MLQAIDWTGVDAVYCGGDLVGYGLHPNEVCALIEGHGIPTTYGNYDHAIARDLAERGGAYRDRRAHPRSKPWAAAAVRSEFRRVAARAGVRRRFAPHQLRHVHPARQRGATQRSRVPPGEAEAPPPASKTIEPRPFRMSGWRSSRRPLFARSGGASSCTMLLLDSHTVATGGGPRAAADQLDGGTAQR
jgi:hypothetical protein